MIRLISVCALIMTWALTGLAQEVQKKDPVQSRPDLSGSWMLNRERSNVGKSSKPDLPLKITHREPELKITRTADPTGQIVARERTYYTDGRGETNVATTFLTDRPDDPNPAGSKSTKSRTRWSGNKIVTRSILRSPVAGRVLEFELIDQWILATDGKTLTQTSRIVVRQDASDAVFIPSKAPDLTRVYSRIGD